MFSLMATFEELFHEGSDLDVSEDHQARLQQSHQVMVHVLKHQVERGCWYNEQMWINECD